ncbi:unnamed protein product [Cladocopium goreaui]|uniref:Serine/threonine-protein kinase ppk15 n=1 Tax=Cladocopium goreaui TaxID=2562237 RepID=A0A9P1CCL6_9DINO|nr:unnamed protein product [Cladocopium goreaui]
MAEETMPHVMPALLSGAQLSHLQAQETLGTAQLREAVKCPPSVDEETWIASQMKEIFLEVVRMVHFLTSFCDDTTCPRMCAGDAEYKWAEVDGSVSWMPAARYMSRLIEDVDQRLIDQSLIPTDGSPMPRHLRGELETMLRRLFRVYAHAYIHHFRTIQECGAEAHVNCSFKHFLFFVLEFQLVRMDEMLPLSFAAPVPAPWRAHVTRPAMEDKETTGPRQERRHGPLLRALTVRIVEVYSNCSGEYAYSTNSNPKRTLTWPCNGVHNGGLDNAEHNYICHVGDKVMNQDANKSYEILESLGQGSFGQVLKCQVDQSFVALKISKNRPAYFNQGCVEANILKRLNSLFDSDDTQHIVRMLDAFVFRKHLCIAFELLDMNLLEFLKWNNYKGVAMATNQSVTRELLEALRCLNHASLIHCDLKPENVMVCSMMPMRIKLIDFGSACTESSMLHSYIQSRFYRSPEVILGLPYSSAIDLWSLGCISAELCLGLPLFPGQCEYDQLRCITKILGLPPKDMLATGSKSKRYFKREERAESNSEEAVPVESHGSHASGDSSLEANSVATTASSREATETTEAAEGSSFKEISGKKSCWRLKTGEEYEHDFNKKAVRSKRSWNFTSVEDIVKDVPEANRNCFLQFLTGLFQMDPNMRWTAKQALQHPFVNEEDAGNLRGFRRASYEDLDKLWIGSPRPVDIWVVGAQKGHHGTQLSSSMASWNRINWDQLGTADAAARQNN